MRPAWFCLKEQRGTWVASTGKDGKPRCTSCGEPMLSREFVDLMVDSRG